jgi:hypothetical protein
VLAFTINGYRVTTSPPFPRGVAPSEEVRAEQAREDFQERLHRAVITAAREARERGEVLDARRFDIEVVQTGEL